MGISTAKNVPTLKLHECKGKWKQKTPPTQKSIGVIANCELHPLIATFGSEEDYTTCRGGQKGM